MWLASTPDHTEYIAVWRAWYIGSPWSESRFISVLFHSVRWALIWGVSLVNCWLFATQWLSWRPTSGRKGWKPSWGDLLIQFISCTSVIYVVVSTAMKQKNRTGVLLFGPIVSETCGRWLADQWRLILCSYVTETYLGLVEDMNLTWQIQHRLPGDVPALGAPLKTGVRDSYWVPTTYRGEGTPGHRPLLARRPQDPGALK